MFQKYLDFAQAKGRAGSTLKSHQYAFKNHIRPFLKGVDIRTVSIEEHEVFLERLKKKGLSPASCNRVRSLLMVLYSVVIKKRHFNGSFEKNPFDCIEPMLEKRKIIEFWNQDSANQFLNFNKDSPYYSFWVFLLNTGLRIGE